VIAVTESTAVPVVRCTYFRYSLPSMRTLRRLCLLWVSPKAEDFRVILGLDETGVKGLTPSRLRVSALTVVTEVRSGIALPTFANIYEHWATVDYG
jgi:hypothetical protein